MASYIVLNPPGVTGKDEKVLFIRDGFSFFGLLFPWFHLLWNRLWMAALTLFAVILAGEAIGNVYDLNIIGLMLDAMARLYLGLEGGQLKASVLKSKGWSEQAIISAQNLGDAEALYFIDENTTGQSAYPKPVFARIPRENRGPALGLLNPYGGQ